MLLLSRNTGAILPFLTGSNRAKGLLGGFRITYIDDAQQSFAGAAFVEAERAALEKLAGHIVPVTARGTDNHRFDQILADVDASASPKSRHMRRSRLRNATSRDHRSARER